MKRVLPEHETLLEIGIIVFVGLLLSLLGALLSGWLMGSVKRSRRLNEPPPPAKSVADERHQQVAVAAAR